jgi:hypothetical protein
MKKIFFGNWIMFLGLFGFLFISSCEWIYRPGPCDASGPVVVYKTKNNYDNNLTVRLSKNGKEVTAYPGKSDAPRQKPTILANGYRLKRMIGDTYLSITIDEYANSDKEFSDKDFLELVIDNNPYLEIYECCKCTGKDTSLINTLIRENRLRDCENLK